MNQLIPCFFGGTVAGKIKSSFFLIAYFTGAVIAFSQTADPLTGNLQFSVPIGTISTGSLSAPIFVSYHGGGMKLSAGEGSAGVGWSLVAGGSISREVKSLPDDYNATGDNRRGWIYDGATVNAFVPTSDENCTDWTTLDSFAAKKDTEPDVFRINAPGLSGKFIFDATGTIRTVPYQDLAITYTSDNSGIIQFTVTTNLGVVYHFTEQDNVSRRAHTYMSQMPSYFANGKKLYDEEMIFCSAWNLTSINAPDGSLMKFEYDVAGTTSTSAEYFSSINESEMDVDTAAVILDEHRYHKLKSINSTNDLSLLSASFTWTDNLISTVTITDKILNQSKAFRFVYQPVRNTSEDGYHTFDQSGPKFVYGSSKNFLQEIKEERSCASFPSFQFSYYGVNFSTDAAAPSTTTLPFTARQPTDLWGYFNGATTAVGFVPTIYKNESAADANRYRINIKNASNVDLPGYTLVTGHNRSVNPATIHLGSLQKITFPSGGFGEITYEPSDYYDPITNTSEKGGGVRVKSVKTSDGDSDVSNDMTTNYDYTLNGRSSGAWTYPPVFAYANGTGITRSHENLSPEEILFYEQVSVSSAGQGKTVYKYLLPGMYPLTSQGPDWNASKSRLAKKNSSCPSSGNLKPGFYSCPFAPNTNFEFERGLISTIATFNEGATSPAMEKKYSYQRVGGPVIAVKAIQLATLQLDIFDYTQYTILCNINKLVQSDSTKTYDQSTPAKFIASATAYTYSDTLALPRTVVTTNSDGTTYTSISKYVKDYPTGNSNALAQVITFMKAKRRGTLIESYQKKGSSVVSANLILYNTVGGSVDYMPGQQLSLQTGSAFSTSAIQSGNFTYSPNYFVNATIESYDSAGQVKTAINRQRNRQSFHYANNSSLPVVAITQAKPKEVVFTDFEVSTGYELSFPPASVTITDQWTGKKSLAMTPAMSLDKTSVTKGAGRYYKFSYWVKATTVSPVTISGKAYNGASVTASASLQSATTTWKYMEGNIDMTNVTSPFTFKVTTSADVLIDDVAFYPALSSIATSTYEPLQGKTSEFGLNGMGAFYVYDGLGRLSVVKDQNKDIVQVHDYHFKNEPIVPPTSSFIKNVTDENINAVTPVTFTANASCFTGTTYTWYVDDLPIPGVTGPVLTYTFTNLKDYRVRLRAFNSLHGFSDTQIIVSPMPLPIVTSIALASGQAGSIVNCPPENCRRTYTAAVTSGLCGGPVKYRWFYILENSTAWKEILIVAGFTSTINSTGDIINFSLIDFAPCQRYAIKCIVETECNYIDDRGQNLKTFTSGQSQVIDITYSAPANCQ
jgi:hypothetical protein